MNKEGRLRGKDVRASREGARTEAVEMLGNSRGLWRYKMSTELWSKAAGILKGWSPHEMTSSSSSLTCTAQVLPGQSNGFQKSRLLRTVENGRVHGSWSSKRRNEGQRLVKAWALKNQGRRPCRSRRSRHYPGVFQAVVTPEVALIPETGPAPDEAWVIWPEIVQARRQGRGWRELWDTSSLDKVASSGIWRKENY